MINAVIFDMDGVIIDSEPIHIQQNYEIFKEMGKELSKEVNYTLIGTNSKFKWEKLKRIYDLPYTVDDLIKLDRDFYFKHLVKAKDDLNPIEGVRELIANLSNNGLKLALASSSPVDVIKIVLEAFNIEKYFSEIVSGDFVKKSKPEPDIFIYAADKIKSDYKDCIVVEDSNNGIIAAKAAKMRAIGFKNPSSYNQDLSAADLVVNSFSELDYNKIISL